MKAKPGVNLDTRRPELARLDAIITDVYEWHGKKPVVTSTNDSKHMKGSLHYQDAAEDLRANIFKTVAEQEAVQRQLRDEIEDVYPRLYEVFLEGKGTPSAHFHLEFSPTLVAMVFGKEPPATVTT